MKHNTKQLTKAPFHHKYLSWNKKHNSLCDWVKTHLEDMIRMTQEDLGSKPTYVHWQNWMEGVGHHSFLQDSLVLPDLMIRMLFSCSHDVDYFLNDFLCPSCSVHFFMCLALHFEQWSKMLCADMLVNYLHRLHMIAHLQCTTLRWVATILVFTPSLKHQGQNDFSPTLGIWWNI